MQDKHANLKEFRKEGEYRNSLLQSQYLSQSYLYYRMKDRPTDQKYYILYAQFGKKNLRQHYKTSILNSS